MRGQGPLTALAVTLAAAGASNLADLVARTQGGVPQVRSVAGDEAEGAVSVIDTQDDCVVDTVRPDGPARGMRLSADGRRLYVAMTCPSRPRDPEMKPAELLVAPDGRTVYISAGNRNFVTVLDAERDVVVARFPTGERPWGIALTDDGAKLYAANELSNDVSVIDTRDGRLVKTIPLGEKPWDVAVAR